MQVAELRKSQVEAGMVQDPDPEVHLAVRGGTTKNAEGKDIQRVPCTTLPPAPKGAEEKLYVCEVKTHAPNEQYTILGVDFLQRKYEPVSRGIGVPPEYRLIHNVHRLAANQVKALEMAVARRRVSGQTGERDANDRPVRVDEALLSDFIVLRLVQDADEQASRISALESENDALRRELAEIRAGVKAAIPTPSTRKQV